jgi:hypothetical protein
VDEVFGTHKDLLRLDPLISAETIAIKVKRDDTARKVRYDLSLCGDLESKSSLSHSGIPLITQPEAGPSAIGPLQRNVNRLLISLSRPWSLLGVLQSGMVWTIIGVDVRGFSCATMPRN